MVIAASAGGPSCRVNDTGDPNRDESISVDGRIVTFVFVDLLGEFRDGDHLIPFLEMNEPYPLRDAA